MLIVALKPTETSSHGSLSALHIGNQRHRLPTTKCPPPALALPPLRMPVPPPCKNARTKRGTDHQRTAQQRSPCRCQPSEFMTQRCTESNATRISGQTSHCIAMGSSPLTLDMQRLDSRSTTTKPPTTRAATKLNERQISAAAELQLRARQSSHSSCSHTDESLTERQRPELHAPSMHWLSRQRSPPASVLRISPASNDTDINEPRQQRWRRERAKEMHSTRALCTSRH